MYNRHWSSDRRRFQRLKVNLAVAYEVYQPLYLRSILAGQEIKAAALDLGGGGMAILTNYNIPVLSTLLIKFLFFKTDKEGRVSFSEPVDIAGEVRSVIPYPNNEYRLGIAFKGIGQNEENHIVHFAESANSP